MDVMVAGLLDHTTTGKQQARFSQKIIPTPHNLILWESQAPATELV